MGTRKTIREAIRLVIDIAWEVVVLVVINIHFWWSKKVSRSPKIVGFTIALTTVIAVWKRHKLPIWYRWLGLRIANFFLLFTQNHPHLSRVLHVFLNLIPDSEFLVLAMAGLAYLMPALISRIEASRALRRSVTAAFLTFALITVVVNAINREEESHAKALLTGTINDQNKKLNGISDNNDQILKFFISSKGINEGERRENIEKALRNEYITSTDAVDPDILAGIKMPPDAWMNNRLKQLGEKWMFTPPVDRTPTQIVQQISPEPTKATIIASFYQSLVNKDNIKDSIDVPLEQNIVKVSLLAMAVGDVPAENVTIWFRVCSVCKWVSAPGFNPEYSTNPLDRSLSVSEMLPNVASPKWDVEISLPSLPRETSTVIGFYVACKNCIPVDWAHPQMLYINRPKFGFKLHHIPQIFHAPAPQSN